MLKAIQREGFFGTAIMWEGIFKKEKKKDNTNQVSFIYGSCYSTPFLARQHDPLLDNGISLTRYSQYFIEKDKKNRVYNI